VSDALSDGSSDAVGRADNRELARAGVTELFGLHYRRLVGLAAMLVDDTETAEDVVQDAFEGLYRRWRRLRDPQAAAAYLNHSVVNQARTRLRRRATQRTHLLRDPGPAPSAETHCVAHGAEDALADAVRALPARQREVIVLRYYLDLSEAQIADWLGVSHGSVKQHAHRATATLQGQMESWS
jgi:RNA polymerase sigma-70 factor (sigma-E family)